MRILYVITRGDVAGGAQEHVKALATAFAQSGHTVSIATGVSGRYFEPLAELGVSVVAIPSMARKISPWADLRSLIALRRLMADFRPDLVSSHTAKAGVLARVAAQSCWPRPRSIFTPHGWSFGRRSHWALRLPYWLIEWAASRMTDTTVAVCEDERRMAHKFFLDGNRIETIYNGVRDSGTAPHATNCDTLPYLVSVARFEPPKDHETLIQALAAIQELPWKARLIGDGTQRARVEKLVAQAGLSERVEFCGETADVTEYLAGSKLLVLSSDSEAFPRVVLEAMSAGVPVVATQVGGVPEAVTHQSTGLLTPPRDPKGMADAIRSLLSDTALHASMAAEARRRFCAEFRQERMIEQHQELYRSVCGEVYDRTRPRVLYLITRAERGGAQIHVRDLFAGFRSIFECVLATGESSGYLVEAARAEGVATHSLDRLQQRVNLIDDLLALAAAVNLIFKVRPDLIHAHTSKAGFIGRLAGFLTRTPVIFTAHTWSFAEGIGRKQQLLSIPLERLAGWLGGSIITVCEANRCLAIQQGIPERKLVTVWNGVPDHPLRANPGAGGTVRFVMAARFAPQKDQSLLVRAFAELDGDCELLLAGDGPLREAVQREAMELGVAGKVRFLGEREDIASVLAECQVFVLSTRWEGLPLSILDAMRAGMPIIASDVGGVSELVTPGQNGFLVPARSVAPLVGALEALRQNDALRIAYGRESRRRFERDFTLEAILANTRRIYEAELPPVPPRRNEQAAEVEVRVSGDRP